MAGEIIGDLICLGLEGAVSDDGKASKGGCLVLLILLIAISGWIYYLANTPPILIKGIIVEKLPNNTVLVKGNEGLNTYMIPSELYLNKKKKDSIIINK